MKRKTKQESTIWRIPLLLLCCLRRVCRHFLASLCCICKLAVLAVALLKRASARASSPRLKVSKRKVNAIWVVVGCVCPDRNLRGFAGRLHVVLPLS